MGIHIWLWDKLSDTPCENRAVFEVDNESERISKSCWSRQRERTGPWYDSIYRGSVKFSTDRYENPRWEWRSLCSKIPSGVGKKEKVSRVFPNSMEKRMSVGEQERVKRKGRTDENKRINWWLEMIISGQCLKMRARKMAYWVETLASKPWVPCLEIT